MVKLDKRQLLIAIEIRILHNLLQNVSAQQLQSTSAYAVDDGVDLAGAKHTRVGDAGDHLGQILAAEVPVIVIVCGAASVSLMNAQEKAVKRKEKRQTNNACDFDMIIKTNAYHRCGKRKMP